MRDDMLFPVRRATPPKAVRRSEMVKRWKRDHGILTDCHGDGSEKWMAISVAQCRQKLQGLRLTDEDCKDAATLMSRYCRVLDESGLIHYGPTEFSACKALVTSINT